MFDSPMIPFWTAVAAAAASLSAVAAAVYTFLTYRLVVAQSEPKVVVYVCADPDRQTLVLIRVENIGRDVATDLSFKPSRSIPALAFGLSVESVTEEAETMTSGPLIEGIAVLGPGDSRDITWGQFGGVMKALGEQPIDLEFSYHHGRRVFRGRSRLEVASFSGTDASRKPPEAIAKHLEDISKIAESLSSDLSHILRDMRNSRPTA